jgi:anti-sigma B factor antagonist
MASQTTSTALSIQVHDESDYVVITPVGEIGVINSGRLRDRLFGLADRGRPLVTDLDQVSLADAAGLGVLVGAANRVAAHGTSMYVVCTQQETLRQFEQTGVDRKIQLVRTVEEAVREMAMAPPDTSTDDPGPGRASGLSRRAARGPARRARNGSPSGLRVIGRGRSVVRTGTARW